MTMHYVKLWNNLIKSSILEQDLHVRWLWIVLLLEADQEGLVYGTPEALARIANMPLDKVHEALAILTAPDPKSTTGDEQGRRVTNDEPNLWYLVNYKKYRNIKDIEEERKKTAERVRRHREKKKAVTDVTAPVTPGNPIVVGSTYEVDVGSKKDGRFAPPSLQEVQAYAAEKNYHFSPEAFVAFYQSKGWKVGKQPMKDWHAACVTWENRWKAETANATPAPSVPSSPRVVFCRDCKKLLTKQDLYKSGMYCQDCLRERHA